MVKPWDTATIGDFLDFKNGLNKGKEFFGYGTPIVNYTDVYRKRGLTKSDVRGKVNLTRDEIHRFDARKNDVFFTRTSETPEEVGMSSVLLDDIDDCVFSGFVLRGRPKNDMFVPEYCKYCFTTEAIRSAIIMGCTYTTRALTNGTQLSAIEIVVPPKPEQEAIAKSLTEIDDLISSLEKLITKKKTIKQGAMQELLTGKRRLPGFSGEWRYFNLMKNSKVKARIGWQGLKKSEYLDSGYALLVTGTDFDDGRVLWDGCHYVTRSRYEQDRNIQLQNNDILITKDGSLGKAALVQGLTKPATLNSGIFVIRPLQDAYDPVFVYQILSSFVFKNFLDRLSAGSTIIHLYQKDVGKFEFLLPPTIAEQKAIAEALSEMDSDIAALENKLTKYRQVKQGMMQQLLTGKIRLM